MKAVTCISSTICLLPSRHVPLLLCRYALSATACKSSVFACKHIPSAQARTYLSSMSNMCVRLCYFMLVGCCEHFPLEQPHEEIKCVSTPV
jgi:hypothetical protein